MKKKAQYSDMRKLILALVLLLILMAIFVMKPFKNMPDFFIRQSVLKDADYDGDGLIDINNFDASPCVYGEAIVEIAGMKEYLYEVAVNGQCVDSQLAETEVTLKLMIDSSTSPERQVCIYPRDTCAKKLQEYHDRLIAEEKARRAES